MEYQSLEEDNLVLISSAMPMTSSSLAVSNPARSNIPPLDPKSFCMSTTITTVFARSRLIGVGFAARVALRPPPVGASSANALPASRRSAPDAATPTTKLCFINFRRFIAPSVSAKLTPFRPPQVSSRVVNVSSPRVSPLLEDVSAWVNLGTGTHFGGNLVYQDLTRMMESGRRSDAS